MTYACLVLLTVAAQIADTRPVTVGSKAFTESAILGELVVQLTEDRGIPVTHMEQLGGTGILWGALQAGEVDIYPDYTGTIIRDILKQPEIESRSALRAALAARGVQMSGPLGFENSYELGMPRAQARRLNIRTISDLQQHPELKFAFSPEFLDRPDGWPGLRSRYDLPQRNVRSMEHALAYRAAQAGDVDVIDVYGTDANVKQYDLAVLEDDRYFFPEYAAVLLYRDDLTERYPALRHVLDQLEGRLDRERMLNLNAMVDTSSSTPRQAANRFLRATSLTTSVARESGTAGRLWDYTWQHLWLVAISLTATILTAVPLGIAAAKAPRTQPWLLGFAEIVQTIPGLALLALLITPLGMLHLPMTGATPAIIALFLYSLLPVMRNTYAAVRDIPRPIRESAEALGLTPLVQLWRIELPLAAAMILAGIKTAAVINVGYATLGALIGAGGYGTPILQGLYRNNVATMLEGAIPAAVLALLVKGLFELGERLIVPRDGR